MKQEFPGFGQQQGPDFKRLFLAGLLTLGVLMVFNYLFVPAPKKIEAEAIVTAPEVSKPKEILPPTLTDAPVTLEPSKFAQEVVAPVSTAFKIPVSNAITEKDAAWPRGGYLLTAKNTGASLSELAVFGYKSPIALLEGSKSGMFFLKSRTGSVSLYENSPYKVVSATEREISYERTTPEGLRVVRRYRFVGDNYLLKHEIEIENLSATRKDLDLDLIFRTEGKIEESSFFSGPTNEFNFLARKDGSLERHAQGKILEGPVTFTGATDYIGFEQRYFLVSIHPKNPKSVGKIFAQAEKVGQEKNGFQSLVTMSLNSVALDPAGKVQWEFDSYVGPKQLGLLNMVAQDLGETINFGWFGIISRPLLWLLVKIYDFVHNFGIAIILLTLLIKLLTYPLTQKSFVSMQQVKKIGPEIKALEKKYGHDRTMLSQKQMELYKEKGVNPMAGCLPMFLQFPIWIALYQMLSNSIEIYQKPFAGWLTDLTHPDPYYVLPVLMGLSMVVQQLLQPVQDDQKAMKYAMLGTSVLFTYIMLSLPSGLSLYMLTNNVLTVIQQVVIKKRFEMQTA